MVALDGRQLQGRAHARQHRGGRQRPTALLKSLVVSDGHVCEARHLITAQTRGAPPPTGGKSDIGRRELLPSTTQELAELHAITHHRSPSPLPPASETGP